MFKTNLINNPLGVNMFPFVVLGAGALVLAYRVWRESHFHWVTRDVAPKIENDTYSIRIEPDFQDKLFNLVPNGIRVVIENKTDDDLIIDWANTLYVANGNTDGNFIFDGRQVSTQIMTPRSPDVVFPKRMLTKVIKPAAQVQEYQIPSFGRFAGTSRTHWHAPALKAGEHGVYLSLRHGGLTVRESLAFILNHERKPSEPEVQSVK